MTSYVVPYLSNIVWPFDKGHGWNRVLGSVGGELVVVVGRGEGVFEVEEAPGVTTGALDAETGGVTDPILYAESCPPADDVWVILNFR